MLRRRILGGFFKMKIDPESLNFVYGIKKTINNEPYLYETGTITGSNPVVVTRNNKTYYKLEGRGEGTSNIAFVNFKTTKNNQVVKLNVFDECNNENDFLAVCKLDSVDINPLKAKITGGDEQVISFTVAEAGSHFIKLYYYQHNNVDTNGTHAGYFRLEPYYNEYEWGYDAPASQQISIKSYYGWNIKSKSSWITLDKNTDSSGTKRVTITVAGNPGDARVGEVIFAEKQSGDEVKLTVNQAANPHPNDILLSLEKGALTNETNKNITIGVTLVGNTSYTITNENTSIYEVSPMSGSGNLTITNKQAGNHNTPITFNISGNAGISKDIMIYEDNNRVACYCDCNRFDGCGCDVERSFTHKDIVGCSTESTTACDKHCESYDYVKCSTHDSCLSQCKSECASKHTVCDCDGPHNPCSDSYTAYGCNCHGVKNLCTDGYTQYSCVCHGPHSSCNSHLYTADSCNCYGAKGDCNSHLFTAGGCDCHGAYGCQSHSTYSAACNCHGAYGCQSHSTYGDSCNCHGSYGCSSHKTYDAQCTCNGVNGCSSHLYTSGGCTCHGTDTSCGSHLYTSGGCTCNGTDTSCSSHLHTNYGCSCHGTYRYCNLYTTHNACSNDVCNDCSSECSRYHVDSCSSTYYAGGSDCLLDESPGGGCTGDGCWDTGNCNSYCSTHYYNGNDRCSAYCGAYATKQDHGGSCMMNNIMKCFAYWECSTHEFYYGCRANFPSLACSPKTWTGQSGMVSYNLVNEWCDDCRRDGCISQSTYVECDCNGTYKSCTDGYTPEGCDCNGSYGCSSHSTYPASCSCNGSYECSSHKTYAASCGCHGSYGCSSHSTYPASCGCNGQHSCSQHIYTAGGCTCHGTDTSCSSYLYTAGGCTCHGTDTSCSSHLYTPGGCTCHGTDTSCSSHLNTADSCSCHGAKGDCNSHLFTAGGCGCHGAKGDCTDRLTPEACSCHGVKSMCTDGYTPEGCSCHGAKQCSSYTTHCAETYAIGTNDNGCACNDKTYHPYCDCDSYCSCHGYTIPVVE